MNRNILTVCITAALGLGLSVPVTANQNYAADTADDLSEIIVTARRSEERLQDVPISMTVFDQQQLTDRNIVSAGDLAAFTPSLSVDNQFGQDVAAFSIRGFVQALNTTPSVAVYFADAVEPRGGAVGEPAGSGAPLGSFFDLQNVQVLKGPQGTLFGRNTDGGAVLLVPQKPTSEFEGYLEDSNGSFGLERVQAVVNIPVNDSLRVRLGVDHEVRNGYAVNVSGVGPSDFNNINYTAARLSVVADITPDLENYLIGSYNLSDNNGPMPQIFACNPTGLTTLLFGACSGALAQVQAGGPYAVANDLPDPKSYLRQFQIVDTITWHASDALTVKNIASYGDLLTSLDSALFGFNFVVPAGGVAPPGPLFATTSNPTAAGADTTDQYTITDELRVQGNSFSNSLNWQSGLYIERSGPLGDPTGTRSANLISCTDVSTFQCAGIGQVGQSAATVHFSDLAAYTQATYKITDQFSLTGGLRYTEDKTSSNFNGVIYVFPGGAGPPVSCESPLTTLAMDCVQHADQNSHAPTYVIDLDYKPTEDLLLYGKYSRGYRQGGIATFVADGYHTYEPEHVNAYEIGEKLTFKGPVSGIFNVSAFFNDFTNQQLLAGFVSAAGLSPPPTSGIVNAGKSHIWGVEVETAITRVKPVTVGLSYTYLRTDLVSFAPTQLPGPLYAPPIYPSVIGGNLPFSPENKLSANASYKLPVPDTLGSLAVSAIFTYTSSALISANDPYAILHPYGLLNMNLTWNSVAGQLPLDVELFVTNLTNRLYYNNVTQLYNTPFGADSRFLGEPRMYGARVRVRFGKT